MAEIINMPRLSDTMEEGVVAKWLKKVGDKVEEGDILAEIETDKATMEFESFYEGTLLHIGIEEGEGAPVDALLAVIGEEGEDITAIVNKNEASSSGEQTQTAPEETETPNTTQAAEIPAGVEVVTMPRLSDTMEEGTVATWLKKVGDKVEEGDILAEIETDKATMEFESFYEGTLLHIGIQEGESAPVDNVLAIIGPEGTNIDAVLTGVNQGGKPKQASATSTKEEEKTETTTSTQKDDQASNNKGRIFISPLAKKMAEDKGIDLTEVKGTGENGRIVKRDIENYSPAVKAAVETTTKKAEEAPAPVQIYTPAGEEHFDEVKNSQMRKTIAKRLSESKFTAPHYYLTIELDMTNAMQSRKQINALPDVKVSFNDMVIKASAMALRKHPQVNTQWTDNATRIAKHIHVGVAVAVDEGLVVPVLKFADQMTMTQIGGQIKDLAGKARNKKLQPSEMEGSTFTVSNLGMFGIQEFTSIINQPNSAILSVGTIVEKPVVKNGEIVVGNTMKVTLACDHRTVDGATGAQFLQTFKQYMESPVTMLA
ncbi:pyruvate dehydrogenase E2 component (dihydrolipoamide acetyltransferase) [Mesonia hippocampi]|uniref:Acetyltransferase component of pyruvate dehydrogenase complex n=1 Tax=Mesonia hippocampi TaxID=1628250 RepID=A0A840EVE1_9FLAO|nr:pyruvate dehydrogenase complex dihydrolipoamide acetyltransferase [Mesonia hippocampi]MBB4119466.1 pyruvate dehydrogenase E2 component (dihydrolipoamide acetyltransferase) [Mesonia hippocampi]